MPSRRNNPRGDVNGPMTVTVTASTHSDFCPRWKQFLVSSQRATCRSQNKWKLKGRQLDKNLFALVVVSVLAQIIAGGLASGQILTHGPVVGGVTASNANVFVRTD